MQQPSYGAAPPRRQRPTPDAIGRAVRAVVAPRLRAALYCRVSTQAQAEDEKVSLSEQLADGERYCQEHDYDVVARYQDVASGATSRRPDFQRLLRDAAAGAFDVVVCWKVDRLGRGLFPMSRLLEVLEPAGIPIEAVKERVDQKYLGLFASLGKIELDNIRERTMAARTAYARQGKMPNRMAPYGYRVAEDGTPTLNETESAIVLEAARRYAAGERVEDIGADLRARGVPTRKPDRVKHGYPWNPRYLRRLITDEGLVTGERPYGAATVHFPALYDATLWDAIVRRKARNKHWAARHTQHPYLLQHLLYCRGCGLRFLFTTRQDRPDGPLRRGAVCGGMQDYPGRYACRPVRQQRVAPLEDAVWARVVEGLRQPEPLVAGLRARLAAHEAGQHQEAGDGEPERELAALETQRREIARQRIRGTIDDATLDDLQRENDAAMAHWREQADVRRTEQAGADEQRRVLERALARVDALRRCLGDDPDGLPFADRRELVVALVDRVWVEPTGELTVDGVLCDPDDAGAQEGEASAGAGQLGDGVEDGRAQIDVAGHRRGHGVRVPTPQPAWGVPFAWTLPPPVAPRR